MVVVVVVGASVGTPTCIPWDDPHDALILLSIHTSGTNCVTKWWLPPVGIGQNQTKLALGF